MSALFGALRGVLRCGALLCAALALAACTTYGAAFDSSTLDRLVPGETTLAQTSILLQAAPANIYRQTDGSSMARWAHHTSFVADAVYFHQELWLAFDANGRYAYRVRSDNVPAAHALEATP